VVNIAGAGLLLWLLRRHLGRVDLARTAPALGRIVVASAFSALGFFIWLPLDRAFGRSFGGQVGSLLPALVAATALYLGACRVLGVRELQALVSLRRHPR
jgi:hypothetical protein